ncbi:hypothetical protein GLOIN_2v1710289 [Rhizophagus clarus]|uniref:Crinkler effector protein N-terminal domain-containing protein n=1 Tax=Rhizophagus clarus TaxID=94130 RepID=A0A8H3L639_9GLOM|nr:hypothetical protein GLOIN_2v1710289 [Rhizophagus clarus]
MRDQLFGKHATFGLIRYLLYKSEMSVKLFCLVKGKKITNAFSVKISRDEPISELKKVIKARKQNYFAGVERIQAQVMEVEPPASTVSTATSSREQELLRRIVSLEERLSEFYDTTHIQRYRRLFDNKLLWRAETEEGSHQIVVKYTRKYNKHAHELCFGIKKAPRLLSVEMICGFNCVVMDYIEGRRLSECDDLKRSEPP